MITEKRLQIIQDGLICDQSNQTRVTLFFDKKNRDDLIKFSQENNECPIDYKYYAYDYYEKRIVKYFGRIRATNIAGEEYRPVSEEFNKAFMIAFFFEINEFRSNGPTI